MGKARLIIGISGASGILYGVRLLEMLRQSAIETHLVVSRAGELTRAHEVALSTAELKALAAVSYSPMDVGAAIASGSFRTIGMVIAPCSMRSLAEIASGATTTLLTRAADVTLKERRRLVLLVRETPLSAIHLRNMLTVTEAGAVVMPPVPAFYQLPKSIDEMVTHTCVRVLDQFGIEAGEARRWGEDFGWRAVGAGEDGADRGAAGGEVGAPRNGIASADAAGPSRMDSPRR